MKQFTTKGIVLTRTDFGEADRIITFITPDQGKIKTMAKGVRKSKAKLAGSVEPFGVSDLSVIESRGEIHTLTSARLIRHYGNLINDLKRTTAGFEMMNIMNKATQDRPEESFFALLDGALEALNDLGVSPELTLAWFKMQLLKLSGHLPNLHTDESGNKLAASGAYNFNYDKMCFTPSSEGEFDETHIKFLRLGFSTNRPKALNRIKGIKKLVDETMKLIDTTLQPYI